MLAVVSSLAVEVDEAVDMRNSSAHSSANHSSGVKRILGRLLKMVSSANSSAMDRIANSSAMDRILDRALLYGDLLDGEQSGLQK